MLNILQSSVDTSDSCIGPARAVVDGTKLNNSKRESYAKTDFAYFGTFNSS